MPGSARPLTYSIRQHAAGLTLRTVDTESTTRVGLGVAVLATMAATPVLAVALQRPTLAEILGSVLLAAVVTLVEHAVNGSARTSRRFALRASDAVVAAFLAYRPGTYIVVGLLLGSVLQGALGRRGVLRTAWVSARDAAALVVGLQVALTLPEDRSMAAVLGMASAGVTLCVIGAVERMLTGVLAQAEGTIAAACWYYALAVSIGIAAGTLIPARPEAALLFVVPISAALRQYGARQTAIAERVMWEDLLQYLHETQEAGVEAAARALHHGLETTFASPQTTVVVTVIDEEFGLQVDRDRDGVVRAHPVQQVRHAGMTALQLTDRAHSATYDTDRSTFTALIGPPAHDLSALVEVHWGAQPTRTRGQRERVAVALCTLAGSWLANALGVERATRARERADDATGDVAALVALGADTRPALDVLHRATRRLAELTSRPAHGDMVDMVAELDSAAQAVATLIGAATGLAHGGVVGGRTQAQRSEGHELVVLGSAPSGTQ